MKDWVWMLPQMTRWRPDVTTHVVEKMETFRKMHDVQPADVAYPCV